MTGPRKVRHPALLAAALVITGLAGCTGEAPPPSNVAERHPILVVRDEVALSLKAPFAPDDLSAEQRRKVDGFIRDYLDRGRGVVVLELAGPPGTSRHWVEQAGRLLHDRGLRQTEMTVLSGRAPASGGAEVRMRFAASMAKVPECGDFSSGSSFRPHNQSAANFGCSYQRNFGLMVANPDDLIEARPASRPDPNRIYRVLRTYSYGAEGGDGGE